MRLAKGMFIPRGGERAREKKRKGLAGGALRCSERGVGAFSLVIRKRKKDVASKGRANIAKDEHNKDIVLYIDSMASSNFVKSSVPLTGKKSALIDVAIADGSTIIADTVGLSSWAGAATTRRRS
jgi:hypothetical protein